MGGSPKASRVRGYADTNRYQERQSWVTEQ
jgi:hypothetical protein